MKHNVRVTPYQVKVGDLILGVCQPRSNIWSVWTTDSIKYVVVSGPFKSKDDLIQFKYESSYSGPHSWERAGEYIFSVERDITTASLIESYESRQRSPDIRIGTAWKDEFNNWDKQYKKAAAEAWSDRLKTLQQEAKIKEKNQILIDLDFDD